MTMTDLDRFMLVNEASMQARAREGVDADMRLRALTEKPQPPAETCVQPVHVDERSKNPLRPSTFNEIVGQERAKAMMRRLVDAAKLSGSALDHLLMTGPAGTGKTTFATVIAHELGVGCYQLAAPVSLDTLLMLRRTMQDREILFIDEIHMQAVMERRGKEAATQPEVFLQLLEDKLLATATGMVEFPDITVIGATTDPGRLPEPFLDRFPLRPRLQSYSADDLRIIALHNSMALGVDLTAEAATLFAGGARGVPRLVNNYMRNATALVGTGRIDTEIAREVLHDLNDTSEDGLNRYMQDALAFLYERGRREKGDGTVSYQASAATIATAIGLGRDTKAVTLHVEPWLLQRGLLQIGSGGRILTDAGIERARELSEED